MRALLTIAHRDASRADYVLECPHGLSKVDSDAHLDESREQLISSLLSGHGRPFNCTCAAETDLIDAYPSIDSAVSHIETDGRLGLIDLDEDLIADLVQQIKSVECPTCSIAVLVMPFRLPMVVTPLHDIRCPQAKVEGTPE